jgi:hypothetical protein
VIVALNHSFLVALTRENEVDVVAALSSLHLVQRRTGSLPLVHTSLSMFDMGEESLLAWANRMRGADKRRPLVELLLRLLAGPFIPDARHPGLVEPDIQELPLWLQEVLRALLAAADSGSLVGMISPRPTGGAEAEAYRSDAATVANWFDGSSFDKWVAANPTGRTTLEVLQEAETRMAGRLIVLPSALRSAAAWTLDCQPETLLRAVLGLEAYAAAMAGGLPRDTCTTRYLEHTEVEMSQETAAVWKNPVRRRQRLFVVPSHGEQYFDMHAKPGKRTRVHVWMPNAVDSSTPIYLAHCGKHLT